MLRSEQSIVTYENGTAMPDRLTRGCHQRYLAYARRMLAVYRSGIRLPRRELHRSVANVLAGEANCDRRRVAAFCQLLDDRSRFASDAHGAAAKLRLRTFSIAAKHHPLVTRALRDGEQTEREVKAAISAELGRPWPQVDAALYADVIACQPLLAFDGYESPEALLARYNVAQVQCCLYRAEGVTVTAGRGFKTILRYAKLARLLHEIRRVSSGRYRIDFTGPVSVLHETRRYGVSFARFVPALLACEDWELEARVRTRWSGSAQLNLNSRDGLTSHQPTPDEFDSTVEETFGRAWGNEQDGWRLLREAVVLHDGQVTFVPDFVLRNRDGREVLLEIVGFWTPQYLEKKRQTLRRFRRHRILIAVADRLMRHSPQPAHDVIVYKKRLVPETVLAALRAANQL